jgi:hypothetical protein
MIRRFSFDNPWRLLWRGVTSFHLLGGVLLALALALCLAALLPQTSADGLNSDLEWQAEVQRRFGEVAWFEAARSPLQSIGAFNVADSLGFRLLLALLALALLAHLVDSVEKLWKAWRAHVALEGARHLNYLPWGEIGSVAIYLGGLTVLLGATITDVAGWQTGPLPVFPGESTPLSQNGDLALRVESLDRDGRHGIGELWLGEENRLSVGDLAVGQPLAGGGIGVYLVGGGSGLRVRATSGGDQPLQLVTGSDATPKEKVVIAFTEEEPRHLVGVPEASLVLLLMMPQPEQTSAQPRVQIFEEGSGEFVLEQELSSEADIPVGDVTLALTTLPYATVRVVHDRGAFLSQIGVIGLIGGATLKGFRSRRRTESDTASDNAGLRGGIDAPSTPAT